MRNGSPSFVTFSTIATQQVPRLKILGGGCFNILDDLKVYHITSNNETKTSLSGKNLHNISSFGLFIKLHVALGFVTFFIGLFSKLEI